MVPRVASASRSVRSAARRDLAVVTEAFLACAAGAQVREPVGSQQAAVTPVRIVSWWSSLAPELADHSWREIRTAARVACGRWERWAARGSEGGWRQRGQHEWLLCRGRSGQCPRESVWLSCGLRPGQQGSFSRLSARRE